MNTVLPRSIRTFLLLSCALLFSFGAKAQSEEGVQLKNEIGVSLLSYESSFGNTTNDLGIQLVNGLQYKRHFAGFSLRFSFAYSKTPVASLADQPVALPYRPYSGYQQGVLQLGYERSMGNDRFQLYGAGDLVLLGSENQSSVGNCFNTETYSTTGWGVGFALAGGMKLQLTKRLSFNMETSFRYLLSPKKEQYAPVHSDDDGLTFVKLPVEQTTTHNVSLSPFRLSLNLRF